MCLHAAVELKSGKKIEASLVVVGVGAKPNTEMFKGQLDLLEDKPGGVKVSFVRWWHQWVALLSVPLPHASHLTCCC